MRNNLLHMQIARRELGTEEIPGPENNPRVVKYGKGATKNDEIPWCSYFISWVCEQADIPFTNKGTARSWLEIGRPVEDPVEGDIVVYWRGKKEGWQGHVGFYIEEAEGKIKTLGGNQRNSVSIQEYSKNRVLGYRRLIDQEPKPKKPMNFMKGKRTYTGLIIAAIGAFGVIDSVSAIELADAVNQIITAVGIIVAIYGRYVTNK